MTHSFEEATAYVERFLAALHADDRAGFEAVYQDALATSDPTRPMFRVVNILVANLVNLVAEGVESDFKNAEQLISDVFKGIADPWTTSEKGEK
ncbi:hypothetical protein EDF38_0147 [Frigoribacterium sp. PhB160]|uniref:hypothetical protein n=1 Tax=Frigoribacterium sp. PhB160 TaxID=2485192 RepID=UPI000F4AE731|nr:hypothetical protein [Frigoribacterium sp. PhB160]ROS61068.1 hypothetical protein EDF38_0147 [Frigoribacterium sp. PhB160]